MNVEDFLKKLNLNPTEITFELTMQVIDQYYDFSPTAFINGMLRNKEGENNGSCKLFAFARLHDLDVQKTLACFGDFYRKDVLEQKIKCLY